MPESRRDTPRKYDFLEMDEFDDKVKKYQKEAWNIYDSAPKLEASEMEEELRKGLEQRMEEDIENQVSTLNLVLIQVFL